VLGRVQGRVEGRVKLKGGNGLGNTSAAMGKRVMGKGVMGNWCI